MPYCKFILPTAPTQPVTMNMGMSMPSWYDIVGLDERSNENCAGIETSVQTLRDILDKEHGSTNLPYNRMVLMGFSQGGALSLYTGLQKQEQKLAGIVVLSGYLPHASAFQIAPGLEDTPVFHGHGQQDMLVAFPFQEKTKRHVVEKGLQADKYTTKSYPIAHTVSMPEIADVLQFLKTILPDDETCRISVKDPTEMSVKELKAAVKRAGLQSKAVGLMEKSEFVRLLQDHRSNSAL
jgi:lysophospholipase II